MLDQCTYSSVCLYRLEQINTYNANPCSGYKNSVCCYEECSNCSNSTGNETDYRSLDSHNVLVPQVCTDDDMFSVLIKRNIVFVNSPNNLKIRRITDIRNTTINVLAECMLTIEKLLHRMILRFLNRREFQTVVITKLLVCYIFLLTQGNFTRLI